MKIDRNKEAPEVRKSITAPPKIGVNLPLPPTQRMPISPVTRKSPGLNPPEENKGATIDKHDAAVILFGLLLFSILLNWLNPWVCQIGGVLLMTTLGIILLTKKSFIPALILLVGSIGIAAMAVQEGQTINFSIKRTHAETTK